jgi:hypothetical protein
VAAGVELLVERTDASPLVLGFASSEELTRWREVLTCDFGAWRSEHVDQLLLQLQHVEWRQITKALGMLEHERFDQPRIVAAVAGLLEHPHEIVRSSALQTLRHQGAAALPAIPAILNLLLRAADPLEVVELLKTLAVIPWGEHRERVRARLSALLGWLNVTLEDGAALEALRSRPDGPDTVDFPTDEPPPCEGYLARATTDALAAGRAGENEPNERPRAAPLPRGAPCLDLARCLRAIVPLPVAVFSWRAVARDDALYLAGVRKLAPDRSPRIEVPALEYGVYVLRVPPLASEWIPMPLVFDRNRDTTDLNRRSWELVAELPEGPVFALQYPLRDDQHRLCDWGWLIALDVHARRFDFLCADASGQLARRAVERTTPSLSHRAQKGQICAWQGSRFGALEWSNRFDAEGCNDRTVETLARAQGERFCGRWTVQDVGSYWRLSDGHVLSGCAEALDGSPPGMEAMRITQELSHDGVAVQLAIFLRSRSTDEHAVALIDVPAPPRSEVEPWTFERLRRDRDKAFDLAGRRIDFERNPNGKGHRVTVDGRPISMFFERRSSSAEPAQPTHHAAHLEWHFHPGGARATPRATCSWTRSSYTQFDTSTRVRHTVSLVFRADWTSVAVIWLTESAVFV